MTWLTRVYGGYNELANGFIRQQTSLGGLTLCFLLFLFPCVQLAVWLIVNPCLHMSMTMIINFHGTYLPICAGYIPISNVTSAYIYVLPMIVPISIVTSLVLAHFLMVCWEDHRGIFHSKLSRLTHQSHQD